MAATNAQLAAWLIANSDKKGTPEFDTVGRQYVATKDSQTAPAPAAPTPAAAPASERAAQERPGILGGALDIGQGLYEVPASIATGLGAAIYGGALGLGTLIGGGGGPAAAQEVEGAQRKYTFQPRGAVGQAIGSDMAAVAGLANRPGEAIASAGYPGTGAAVTTGIQAALLALAPEARGAFASAGRAGVNALERGFTAPRPSMRQQQTGGITLGSPAAPVGPTYSKAALNELGRQFARENPGMTANELAAKLGAMGALSGGEARVADVAGRNALDYAAVMPGETNAAMNAVRQARSVGRPERLDPVVDMMSGGAGRAATVASDLVATQKELAGPLYEKVHAMDVPVTPELSDILGALRDSGAFRSAKRIARAERVPFQLDDPSLTTINMRQLDLVKRAADDLVAGAREKTPTLARAIGGLNTEYKAALDTATGGAYADARAAFAGPAASLDALELGRKSGNVSAAQRAEDMARMGPAELQHYRIGAAEQLREQIGNRPGQNKLMDPTNRNVREQLQQVFGDDATYQQALKLIENEKKLKELESVGQGSQTAGRLAMEDDVAANAVEGLTKVTHAASSGNWGEALNAFMKQAKRLRLRESVRNEIGRALLSKDPSIFGLIEKAQKDAAAARAGAARAAAPTAIVTAPKKNKLGP